MNHPSFLALDRHALGAAPEHAAHVSACAQCAAHVASVQRELPIPRWLGAPVVRRAAWWPALALTAALVVLVVLPQPPDTQAKGAPAVTVWLKRAGAVARWQGETVRPGDALRLELGGRGYAHAAVLGGDGKLLFRGTASEMTPAWELDTAPGDEQLRVVFSRAPIAEGDFPGLSARRDTEVWSVELTLKKETR